MRQPLAAIAINGDAALRFAKAMPPALDEVRSALTAIGSDGHRASEVFESGSDLFRRGEQKRQPVNMNGIALEVLRSLGGELRCAGGSRRRSRPAAARERPRKPAEAGHSQPRLQRGRSHGSARRWPSDQMQGVDPTQQLGRNRDCRCRNFGPEIDPKQIDGIFETFVTTKSQGMGLGLAICGMIKKQRQQAERSVGWPKRRDVSGFSSCDSRPRRKGGAATL